MEPSTNSAHREAAEPTATGGAAASANEDIQALPTMPAAEAPPAPIPVVEPAPGIVGLEPPASSPVTILWQQVRDFAARRRASYVDPAIGAAEFAEDGNATSTGAPRANRFVLLAASITLAAGLGAAAGAAGFAGAAKLLGSAESTPSPGALLQRSDLAAETKALKESIAQMRTNIRTLTDSVAGLGKGIDASGKVTGAAIAKLHDQSAKLQDGLERLQRAQPDIVASRAPKLLEPPDRGAAVSAGRAAAAPEVTGSIPAPNPRPAESVPPTRPNILGGWSLRRVYDGVALVDGRYGEIEIMAGDTVRGLGRIHEIKRQDGRWVVVTQRGLIVGK
jgi:hypothetical protein